MACGLVLWPVAYCYGLWFSAMACAMALIILGTCGAVSITVCAAYGGYDGWRDGVVPQPRILNTQICTLLYSSAPKLETLFKL